MAKKKEFQTICCGGPLDGLMATAPAGEQKMTHLQMSGGGCELLPGDLLMTAAGNVEENTYHLFAFLWTWSTGYLWRYHFWVHESYLPISPEMVELLAEDIHPGECHVERMYVPKLERPPTPLFRYGGLTLSKN